MKRHILILLLALLCCGNLFAQQAMLRVGLFADCQSAKMERGGGFLSQRHYTLSPKKLTETIDAFNADKVNLIVSLGDFVDASIDAMEELVPIVAKAQSPLYHLMGNHDFLKLSFSRAQEIMKVNAPYYYSVVENGVRLVMLNTNERSMYATRGTEEYADAVQYLEKLKNEGAMNATTYNGAVSDKQMKWLEAELQMAQKAGEVVVVMSHHPLLYTVDVVTALNNKEVRAMLEKYSCVKVHISGHHHLGGYAELNGIHYLVLKGMVETTNNRFAVMEVYKDRIEIDGRGDEENKTLKYTKK